MSHDTDWQLIRNQFHTYGNPISVAKMERTYDLLDLPDGARVLDVGCGKGEVLIRLVERFGVAAVGVDPSPVLELGRAAAAERVPSGDFTWHAAKLEDVDLGAEPYELTVCIGSHHAFGGYEEMLDGLARLTRPGGLILVGDGFWKQERDPEYLEMLGIGDFEQNSHTRNIDVAEARGLRAIWSAVSSNDEWDEFEWLYRYAMEKHLHEHGFDAEQMANFEARRRFLMGQLRWGRDTMGFALYLFRRPAEM